MKTIQKTSVFPAARSVVFAKLQKLETLQHIAFPYATFRAVNPSSSSGWQVGQTFKFQLKLFGFIPLGIHTIHIQSFDEIKGLSTQEYNKHVPVWNHDIKLVAIDQTHTQYTDIVTIDAGWKTQLVYRWAKCFYAHRQRKWIKLLTKMKPSA